MSKILTIKRVDESAEHFTKHNREVLLYEGMPDELILSVVKDALKKANGLPFKIQQHLHFNQLH